MKKIVDIFDIRYGNQFDISKMEPSKEGSEGINFVNRSAENNGVSGIVERYNDIDPFPAGLITVAMGGSVLASFVQTKPFYTGQNVKVLTPKSNLSLSEKLYYCAAIEKNKFRYGACGREANSTFNNLLVPAQEEISESIKEYDISNTFVQISKFFQSSLGKN